MTLPDLIAFDLNVLFCGINPGACAAQRGHHFLGQGNRFWRVLHLAGFTPNLVHPLNDCTILRYGCGITSAVRRPTARAVDLANREYVLAKGDLVEKVRKYRPAHLAFLGKVAFEAMFEVRGAAWGLQPQAIDKTAIWVLPNPSGLNRGFSLNDLVSAYSALSNTLRASTAPDRSSSDDHPVGDPAARRTCGLQP